ncbi:MAG: Gfo/Idh/MocA family oxidoreductase [Bacteroidales bacterium]|nr:Gfo/Idh/MocA family oxidoreductase [Bacteroidales bacterium]
MIWIIGAGGMAREYAKVLKAQNREFLCIGRSESTVDAFKKESGHDAVAGGLDAFLAGKPGLPEAVIVATDEKSHVPNCLALMQYGVRRILCEKPGFLHPEELEKVAAAQKLCGAAVFYAYNRRFYASTLAAEKIIEEDGGLRSFSFEFTEWGHVIATYNFPKETLANWFFANSTHVVDLAFFIGGMPREITCYAKDESSWHKPVNFAGAGLTEKGALFNYQANWEAPGRWAVELLTASHRIYLKPMEQLQLQDKGSVKVYPVEIDDHLDKEFKPGLYLETQAFLDGNDQRLCSLDHQIKAVKEVYTKIVAA